MMWAIRLTRARRSSFAILLSVVAWAAGCATAPRPAIEPSFAARTYTPIRIALLPPDVFLVLDQVGDNDAARSEALRQKVFQQLVQFSTEAFRQRGYDLNLSARWDGIWDGQPGVGQLLVRQDELASMANAILQFANGPTGAQTGPLTVPQIVAPELAAKIGWATQSDSLLYVNVKGVTVTGGKRTAEIVGAVFIVVVIALIVLAILAEGKGSGGQAGHPSNALGPRTGSSIGAPAVRGMAPGGGVATGVATGGAARGLAPVGRGTAFGSGPGPRQYYGGGGPSVGIGVGLMVPLDGPVYTHSGTVEHDDDWFAGDQLYASWTLVNAADGRVLWHLRADLDLDAQDPKDVRALVDRVVGSLPLRGDLSDGSAPPPSPSRAPAPAPAPK